VWFDKNEKDTHKKKVRRTKKKKKKKKKHCTQKCDVGAFLLNIRRLRVTSQHMQKKKKK